MRLYSILFSILILSSCASPAPNVVQLKMDKATVLKEMGNPNITAGENSTEYFTYYLYPSKQHKATNKLVPYEVEFKNDKVVKYGIKNAN